MWPSGPRRWIQVPRSSADCVRTQPLSLQHTQGICVCVCFLFVLDGALPLGSLETQCDKLTGGRLNRSDVPSGMPHYKTSNKISVLRVRRSALPRGVSKGPSNKCAWRESSPRHTHWGACMIPPCYMHFRHATFIDISSMLRAASNLNLMPQTPRSGLGRNSKQ